MESVLGVVESRPYFLTMILSRRAFLVTTAAKTHFRGFPKKCGFAERKLEQCTRMADVLRKHARWLDLASDVYDSLAEGDEDAAAVQYADFLNSIPEDRLDERVLMRLMTGAAFDLRAADECSDI